LKTNIINGGGEDARILENTDNSNFAFTAPLARYRLRNVLFSPNSHSLRACGPGDESHREVSAFVNQILCI
jgi:hypothetical protein